MVKNDVLRAARVCFAICALGGGLAPVALRAASASQQVESANFTVHFEFDESTLSAETRRELDTHAEWMMKHRATAFSVLGFADRAGPTEYNRELAMRRAIQVASYLVYRGVSANRLSTLVSYGEQLPAIETELAARANRRVIIVAAMPAAKNGFPGFLGFLSGRKAGSENQPTDSYRGDQDDKSDDRHSNEGETKAPPAESGGGDSPDTASGDEGQPSTVQENGNNGHGNGDQDAPGGSADNNNAENDSDPEPEPGSKDNNGKKPDAPGSTPHKEPQGNNGHGNGDQDAPGGSAGNNNAENG